MGSTPPKSTLSLTTLTCFRQIVSTQRSSHKLNFVEASRAVHSRSITSTLSSPCPSPTPTYQVLGTPPARTVGTNPGRYGFPTPKRVSALLSLCGVGGRYLALINPAMANETGGKLVWKPTKRMPSRTQMGEPPDKDLGGGQLLLYSEQLSSFLDSGCQVPLGTEL
ncbi:hypothetical protein GQ607_010023 [Colletotrichum asianum]|uniref:Uncharacterized protein n=1 Tax=Colletotrichum asianum TaxID=702518 RepID=A0A8H3WBH4_9PEZI|nr:hypothetical protein GQ607_010023 [Colletotrichum asianum]